MGDSAGTGVNEEDKVGLGACIEKPG